MNGTSSVWCCLIRGFQMSLLCKINKPYIEHEHGTDFLKTFFWAKTLKKKLHSFWKAIRIGAWIVFEKFLFFLQILLNLWMIRSQNRWEGVGMILFAELNSKIEPNNLLTLPKKTLIYSSIQIISCYECIYYNTFPIFSICSYERWTIWYFIDIYFALNSWCSIIIISWRRPIIHLQLPSWSWTNITG